MKHTLISLIILIVQTGFSQNYIQYNSLICEAENGIVKSNYKNGLENYLDAFKIVKNPFAVDYYNAALCATKLKNDSIALILIEKLLEKGIALRELKSKSFKYLYKTNSWNVLKTKEKDYKKKVLLKQNIELREKLEELLQNDQKIRTKKYGYPMSDTIASVDSLNMIEMKIILDRYGYPDENLIGIKKPQYFNPPQYIVIRHYYQSKHYDLTEILYKSVIEGKLSPRVFAELEDKKSNWLGKGGKYGTVGFFVIQGHIDKQNYPEEVIERYNNNRKKIGLESWGDYLMKIEFQESQKEFYFGIKEGKMTFGGISWKRWNEIKASKTNANKQ